MRCGMKSKNKKNNLKLNKKDTFFNRNNYLLVLSAWLFTFSFIFNTYFSDTSSPSAVQKKIEKDVQHRHEEINKFFEDTVLIEKLGNYSFGNDELNELTSRDYFIFIYDKFQDSLALSFWNTPVVVPDSILLQSNEHILFSHQVNGWYLSYKKGFEFAGNIHREAICLVPIKWDFYIENKYLINAFTSVKNVDKTYAISLDKTSLPIRDLNKDPLFYLTQIGAQPVFHDSAISICLKIAASLLILFFLYTLSNFLVKKEGFLMGFLTLFLSLLFLRTLSYTLPVPLRFSQFELFSSSIYGSNNFFRSLGDLLLNSICFVWLVLFIKYHFNYDYSTVQFKRKWHKIAIVAALSILIVLISIIFANIVRSLVADSQISFDVINFFSLNIYSVIGFIILAFLTFTYFFLVQILLKPLSYFLPENKWYLFLVITICGLLYISTESHANTVVFHLITLFWLLVFLFLLQMASLNLESYNLISSRYIFWLFYFSISISAVIILENRKKEMSERKHFAENLANKADASTRVIMNIILTDFRNEYLAQEFYKFKELESNKRFKDSLTSIIFSSYNNRFDTQIYTFDAQGGQLFNEDSTSYNSLNALLQSQGKATGVPDLYYYDVYYDRFNYITKKEIKTPDGIFEGTVFIISRPRQYKNDAVYPELFSQDKSNSLEGSDIYAFAVYDGSRLSTSYNDYPFTTRLGDISFDYDYFKTIRKNGYEELWYRAGPDKTIVIARQDKFLMESITLFAYLFLSFLLITILFNLVSLIFSGNKSRPDVKSFWQLTLRNQVHGVIILISIFSFTVIGITTILFFISRYHSNNREKLSSTIHIMERELKNSLDTLQKGEQGQINLDDFQNQKLQNIIQHVSNIHSTEVNLYDLEGKLLASSVPLPYEKGILSERMDPTAFYHLNGLQDAQYFHRQMIGTLQYSSNYLPIRSGTGQELGYLNIPYFELQKNLQDEISNFLVTIINLNAFIFLMAGIIALFITNKITRSLTFISNKMKQVSFKAGNEEIVWTKNDEIGELVMEYNKMVKKLEVSAEMLAKSEREGAWREMAQQVAHEIKNPLTPMKLNLQYLQMSIDNGNPDVKGISLYVAKIMLEQIDHLSKIASDFANFANISNTKNQVFDLNKVIENLVELYSMNEKITIETELDQTNCLIEADKTQINRLFTNLLQNAVQAVPDTRDALIQIKSFRTPENNLIISVKDNGNGIPMEKRLKIFTPNFTTKSSGTGLGLAMCKGIVEKMNGHIWFESCENEWTTFFVELPLSVPAVEYKKS